MTIIGLSLNFLKATKPPINKQNSIGLKLAKTISDLSALNSARDKIASPAELISATTAGLRLAKMV